MAWRTQPPFGRPLGMAMSSQPPLGRAWMVQPPLDPLVPTYLVMERTVPDGAEMVEKAILFGWWLVGFGFGCCVERVCLRW